MDRDRETVAEMNARILHELEWIFILAIGISGPIMIVLLPLFYR